MDTNLCVLLRCNWITLQYNFIIVCGIFNYFNVYGCSMPIYISLSLCLIGGSFQTLFFINTSHLFAVSFSLFDCRATVRLYVMKCKELHKFLYPKKTHTHTQIENNNTDAQYLDPFAVSLCLCHLNNFFPLFSRTKLFLFSRFILFAAIAFSIRVTFRSYHNWQHC